MNIIIDYYILIKWVEIALWVGVTVSVTGISIKKYGDELAGIFLVLWVACSLTFFTYCSIHDTGIISRKYSTEQLREIAIEKDKQYIKTVVIKQ